MKTDSGYINFWQKNRPKFTDMEMAIMEGGHSLEKSQPEKYSFIKSLQEPTLGHVRRNGNGVRTIGLLRDSERRIK